MNTGQAPGDEVCNALSVDVEDYYQVSAFAPYVRPETWATYSPRVACNTFRLLELFEGAGVKATFFILGWVAERNAELVEAIHSQGHEVACHGYSHALIFHQTQEVFRAETRRAKNVLEDIIGAEVVGYRAASFSITARSRWAVDILAEEGFLYDSSIFPIRHDRYGMPGAPMAPHRLVTVDGGELIEFPPSAVDVAGVRLPVGGGGYFRLYPYRMSRALIRAINGVGRPCMCYLHPWEIDPDQPRMRAGRLARFRHYVNLSRTEPRLRRLMAEFRLAPVRDVLQLSGYLRGRDAASSSEAVA